MTRQAPQPVPVLLLTPEQAAEACQVSRDQLDEWSHRAGFPVIRDGRVVRVPLAELKEWLGEQAWLTNAAPAPQKQLARLPLRSQPISGGA